MQWPSRQCVMSIPQNALNFLCPRLTSPCIRRIGRGLGQHQPQCPIEPEQLAEKLATRIWVIPMSGGAKWASKDAVLEHAITFTRLSNIEPTEIADHMSDPRVAEHMPLLTSEWDVTAAEKFVAHKERCWEQDGLGHWAFLSDGQYVGWGGFQKEGDEWDFGLVLKPDAFGLGARISRKAIDFALADERIPYVTFLLPPSRKNLGALKRLGAEQVGEIDYDGSVFLKFRLETA